MVLNGMTTQKLAQLVIKLYNDPTRRNQSMKLVVQKLQNMKASELLNFSLQIRDSYAERDRTTPIALLSFVLEHALQHKG